MGELYTGVGALFWLFFIIIALFFGFLSLLMPWFVYQIRQEVSEIREHLIDLKRIVAGLPQQPPADAAPSLGHLSAEESNEAGKDAAKPGQEHDRPPQNGLTPPQEENDDELRYAPPEYKT